MSFENSSEPATEAYLSPAWTQFFREAKLLANKVRQRQAVMPGEEVSQAVLLAMVPTDLSLVFRRAFYGYDCCD